MEIRGPEPRDVGALMDLGAGVIGPERAGPFIRSFLDRHHILVAEREDEVVGFIAYRTDWFQCTFVALVSVHKDARRTGVARALYRCVQDMSTSPRLFSSTEETKGVSIQVHVPLGFPPAVHLD